MKGSYDIIVILIDFIVYILYLILSIFLLFFFGRGIGIFFI